MGEEMGRLDDRGTHVSCAGVAHTQSVRPGCLLRPPHLAPPCVDFYCDDLLPLHTGVYIYLVEYIDTSFSFFSFSFFSW